MTKPFDIMDYYFGYPFENHDQINKFDIDLKLGQASKKLS